MRLDDRSLLGGQRAGLEQDRIGDRHLADVVQRRGEFELHAELLIHPDLLGKERGEVSDPLDVGAGVLVAVLDCHREALDGLGLCELELGQRAVELAGAALDLILECRAADVADLPSGPRDGDCKHEHQQRPRKRYARERHAGAGREGEQAQEADARRGAHWKE